MSLFIAANVFLFVLFQALIVYMGGTLAVLGLIKKYVREGKLPERIIEGYKEKPQDMNFAAKLIFSFIIMAIVGSVMALGLAFS